MTPERFSSFLPLPVPAARAFDWHDRPGAFQRLQPPWQPMAIVRQDEGIADGSRVALRFRLGPAPIRWELEHRDYEPGRQFRDVQVSGPFASWSHLHRFVETDASSCVLNDEIDYELPGGALGRLAGDCCVRSQLGRLFAYRRAVTRDDLALHDLFSDLPRLTVAITGAGGLVGSALSALLTTGGHRVIRMVRGRRGSGPDEAGWDSARGLLEPDKLDGIDAVVHLAGENIASGRWTDERMARIRDSRVEPTRLLAEALRGLPVPPKTFLSASATGIYGNRGDEDLTEASAAGSGFLADVGREWEAAASGPLDGSGVRVVHARLGVVLTPAGGALAKMLPAFQAGLGGPLGDGRQQFSWISLDDAVGALLHLLMTESVAGAVNVTAPTPIRQGEFARTLGRVLQRPAFAPAPAAILRLALGRMADEALLAGARVLPTRLLESNYQFRHPRLEDALRHVLGRAAGEDSPCTA